MEKEMNATLQEIAALLRRGVENDEKIREDREKSRANFHAALTATDGAKELDPMFNELQRKTDAAQKEEREFRAKVVAELERHNDILERIARRLEASAQV